MARARARLPTLSPLRLGLALTALTAAAWLTGLPYILLRLGVSIPVPLARLDGPHLYVAAAMAALLAAKVAGIGLRTRIGRLPGVRIWHRWLSFGLLALYAAVLVSGLLLLVQWPAPVRSKLVNLHLLAAVWALFATLPHVLVYVRRHLPAGVLDLRVPLAITGILLPVLVFAAVPIALAPLTQLGAGTAWRPVGPPRTPLLHLLRLDDGRLVGVGQGVWISTDDAASWHAVPDLSAQFLLAAAVLSLPDLAFWDAPQDGRDDSVQLVVAIAVAVFVGQRVDRERLARKRAEDAEERAKSYAASILRGQEEERQRIAHELHDDPLQALIHLSRRLEALSERHALLQEARSEMAETQLLMTAAAVSLREIAQGLRPPSLDDLGLVPALRQPVARMREGDGLVVDFRVRGASRRLAPETELGLYRIAQEALRNVERHAAARRADLAIAFGSDEVTLGVRDDGAGFDAALAGPRGSLGMAGMEERVALLGGELAVRSRPGRGTSVDVRIPCPAPVSR